MANLNSEVQRLIGYIYHRVNGGNVDQVAMN